MAMEFNITSKDKWFLGEDKFIELPVFAQDGVTPLDVTGMAIQFVMRKTDRDKDPAIIQKTTAAGTITIVGVFNPLPNLNTQKLHIAFVSDDTTNLKPLTYRYSIKRTDAGNEAIFSFGDLVLLQATAH